MNNTFSVQLKHVKPCIVCTTYCIPVTETLPIHVSFVVPLFSYSYFALKSTVHNNKFFYYCCLCMITFFKVTKETTMLASEIATIYLFVFLHKFSYFSTFLNC